MGLNMIFAMAWANGLVPKSVMNALKPQPSFIAPASTGSAATHPPATAALPVAQDDQLPSRIAKSVPQVAAEDPRQTEQPKETWAPTDADQARMIKVGRLLLPHLHDSVLVANLRHIDVPGGWQALIANADDTALLATAVRAQAARYWRTLTDAQLDALFNALSGSYDLQSIREVTKQLYPELFVEEEQRIAQHESELFEMGEKFRAEARDAFANLRRPSIAPPAETLVTLDGSAAGQAGNADRRLADNALSNCFKYSFAIGAHSHLAEKYKTVVARLGQESRAMIASGLHRNDSPALIDVQKRRREEEFIESVHRRAWSENAGLFARNCVGRQVSLQEMDRRCSGPRNLYRTAPICVEIFGSR
jgi:hypothetical protein